MPDTIATLRVKDATGSNITLSAVSGTNGIATYHALTGTIASDISSSLNYNGASAAYWLNTIHSKVETVQGYLTYGGSSAATLINTTNSRLETTNNKLTDISSSVNTIKADFSSYIQHPSVINFGNIRYDDLNDGTLMSSPLDPDRKVLTLYNHTNADVYVRVGSPVTASNGMYSFVLAPSGSKEIYDSRVAKFAYYYSSSIDCTQGYLQVTSFEI